MIMKKQTLSIQKLKVDSFVTGIEQNKVLLGGARTDYKQCGTGPQTINSCEPTNYYECGTGPI